MITTENMARESAVCLGCGDPKPPDIVVCWGCFKHRTDKTPLKYFDGDFQQWLDYIAG